MGSPDLKALAKPATYRERAERIQAAVEARDWATADKLEAEAMDRFRQNIEALMAKPEPRQAAPAPAQATKTGGGATTLAGPVSTSLLGQTGLALVRVTLPYPPSVNAIWRHIVVGKRARVILSREGRTFYAVVAAQWQLEGHGRPMTGPLCVEVHIYRPRRAGDLDNRAKAALDALKGKAFEDDEQVEVLHMYRHEDKDDPRAEVVITRRGA